MCGPFCAPKNGQNRAKNRLGPLATTINRARRRMRGASDPAGCMTVIEKGCKVILRKDLPPTGPSDAMRPRNQRRGLEGHGLAERPARAVTSPEMAEGGRRRRRHVGGCRGRCLRAELACEAACASAPRASEEEESGERLKRLGRERGLGGEFEASRSETTRPTGKKRDWPKSQGRTRTNWAAGPILLSCSVSKIPVVFTSSM